MSPIDIFLLKEQIYIQMQLVNKDLYEKFEFCIGNSPSRTEILKYLYENGKVSQVALQKELNIDKSAITRHLKQLESTSMIKRSKEKGDQRITWVELTKNTLEDIEHLFNLKDQFINDVLADFTQEQLLNLNDMLNTMKRNISNTTIQRMEKINHESKTK